MDKVSGLVEPLPAGKFEQKVNFLKSSLSPAWEKVKGSRRLIKALVFRGDLKIALNLPKGTKNLVFSPLHPSQLVACMIYISNNKPFWEPQFCCSITSTVANTISYASLSLQAHDFIN